MFQHGYFTSVFFTPWYFTSLPTVAPVCDNGVIHDAVMIHITAQDTFQAADVRKITRRPGLVPVLGSPLGMGVLTPLGHPDAVGYLRPSSDLERYRAGGVNALAVVQPTSGAEAVHAGGRERYPVTGFRPEQTPALLGGQPEAPATIRPVAGGQAFSAGGG